MCRKDLAFPIALDLYVPAQYVQQFKVHNVIQLSELCDVYNAWDCITGIMNTLDVLVHYT